MKCLSDVLGICTNCSQITSISVACPDCGNTYKGAIFIYDNNADDIIKKLQGENNVGNADDERSRLRT